MTRIERPQPAPAILLEQGAAQTEKDCAAHASGTLEFEADSTIYGHRMVKDRLLTMQRRKCAYCETLIHDNPGTIDHFRPAGEAKQAHGLPVQRPGYFWLAYYWENLLLACIDCNQHSKKSLFPLADPMQRATCPQDAFEREAPLLIDPTSSSEKPEDYLRFREELLEAIDGNPRGTETIRVLRLNDERRALVGHRRGRLQLIRSLLALIAVVPDSLEALAARKHIAQATGPEGEYSAMMKQTLS